MKEITTTELKGLVNQPNVHIVDVRPVDAYIGWKHENEERRGHIAGARSIPMKWTKYIDWIEVVKSKNIHPEDKIIIYGYKENRIDLVGHYFLKADYQDVNLYYGFIDEWVRDESLPMEFLPRYKNLVSARWLYDILGGETPENKPEGEIVICHAHYQNKDAYLSGHIPGAIDIDTNTLESPETWNRRTPQEIKQTLESHGINSDTTVVLYGKFMFPDNEDEFPGSAAGQIGAIRCALIMMYAGVKDVRILNGGYRSWLDEGFEVETIDVEKVPVPEFGVEIPANPQYFVDTKEAKQMIASDDSDIICVRSVPEFLGEVSGYNYIEKKGRIPGAVFGNCGSDAYHMENYRNLDHTIREAREVEGIWKEAGITPDKHLAFYCGTGWRGSEAFYNAWLMNWPNVAVYDGGWFEWSNDPENPFETGIPKNFNLEKFDQ